MRVFTRLTTWPLDLPVSRSLLPKYLHSQIVLLSNSLNMHVCTKRLQVNWHYNMIFKVQTRLGKCSIGATFISPSLVFLLFAPEESRSAEKFCSIDNKQSKSFHHFLYDITIFIGIYSVLEESFWRGDAGFFVSTGIKPRIYMDSKAIKILQLLC